MSIVKASALTVRYGRHEALSDLELDIVGGVTGLLGPNGAGKSTLLKTLLGVLRPSAGALSVLGVSALEPRSAELRMRLGYFPERSVFVPGMSAVDTVALAGELGGLKRTDSLERAHEVLWFSGLGEARYRLVEEFSTGMKQRTKLACALVHDPDLLLLDEPTSGLDPSGRRQMLELVRAIGAAGISVILSTHLLNDVEQVSDGVVLLDRGRLVLEGQLSSLRHPAGWIFDIRVRETRPGAFSERLQEHGIKSTEDRDGLLRVELNDSATRPLFELAHLAGAEIRHLKRHERNLKDTLTAALDKGTHTG
ncbi:MAG TPA: ABC transporter ATP-binding protein [Vicinamibacteria bacterium]|nr:ABC transporter ATP-binding protein [Vicinamibacteria bacterium]